MKEEKIINNSVSDTNKEEVVRGIDDKLDNIGIYLEKVEAFNQLINIKLDEIKDPSTKAFKTNNHLEDIALDLFNSQSNISNIRPLARIFYNPNKLTHSFNSHFGLWEDKDNKYIYDKIQNIIKEVFKDNLVSDEETPKDTKKEKVGFLDKLKKMFIDD